MKIRGRRKCKECGGRWSYYETGEPACPDCGSLHSVGIDDERTLHTASASTLDLTPIRNDIETTPLERIAERAAEECQEFTRGYGFIDGGELRSLDETYLAAMELRHVGSELARRMTVTDDEELYFTELLRADDGVRPEPEAVPDSLRAMRGLAYANAVAEYRSDLRTYLEEYPDSVAKGVVETLGGHTKRIQALDGDVPPTDAERLVAAARELGEYIGSGNESALTAAESRLEALS